MILPQNNQKPSSIPKTPVPSFSSNSSFIAFDWTVVINTMALIHYWLKMKNWPISGHVPKCCDVDEVFNEEAMTCEASQVRFLIKY